MKNRTQRTRAAQTRKMRNRSRTFIKPGSWCWSKRSDLYIDFDNAIKGMRGNKYIKRIRHRLKKEVLKGPPLVGGSR